MLKKNKIILFMISMLVIINMMSCTKQETTEINSTTLEDTKKQVETTKELETTKEVIKETTVDDKQYIEFPTVNVEKVMPLYKTYLYSVAEIRGKDYDTMNKASDELNNIILADVLKSDEKNIASLNFEVLDELTVAEWMNQERTDNYMKLPENDYNNYLNQNVKRIGNTYKLNNTLSIDFTTIKIYDTYYEFDATFNKPLTISKSIIDELKQKEEDDAFIFIDFPNGDKLEKKKMYYDGRDGFLYYNGAETQKNMQELTIKKIDDNNFAFYRDDIYRIDVKDEPTKIHILKDAYIGRGTDFNFLAQTEFDYAYGSDDNKYLYRIEDLFRRMLNNEKTLFDNTKIFTANYFTYDDRGYITALYDFVEEM